MMPPHPITDETLLAYALGELDPADAIEVETTLAATPASKADLARITALLATMRSDSSEEPPATVVSRAKAIFRRREVTAPGWLDRLTAIIAECIFDSRREVALAGVRGDDEGIQLAFETADAEIDLQAEPTDGGRWRIIGQVADGGTDIEVLVGVDGHTQTHRLCRGRRARTLHARHRPRHVRRARASRRRAHGPSAGDPNHMTDGASEHRIGLDELLVLPENEQLAALGNGAAAETTLVTLGAEAERLATVEVGRAVSAGAALVNLSDRLDADRARVHTRRAYGQALAYSGRLDEALAACTDAVEVAERAALAIEGARARAAMLHPLCKLGRIDEALAEGDRARRALADAGEAGLAGRVDFNLGNIHKTRNDLVAALESLDRARAALAGDDHALGHVENTRGEVLLQLNDFEGSEAAFARAAAIFAEHDARFALAVVEGNLADLFARRGRLQAAIEHFERARRAIESDTATGHLARLVVERADAIATLGLPADALATYDDAIPRLETIGLAAELVRAHIGRAEMLGRLNRLDDADRSIHSAETEIERLGGSPERPRAVRLRAALAARRGDHAAAVATIEETLDELAGRPADAAIALVQLAQARLDSGAIDDAASAIERAISTANSLDLAPLLADAHHVRAHVRKALGDGDGALEDLRTAAGHVERVRGTLRAERYRVAWLGTQLDIYEEMVRTVFEVGRSDAVHEAFGIIERARSRSLLESVQRALDDAEPQAAVDPRDRELLERLAALRTELNALYSRLDESGPADQRHIASPAWRSAIVERERRIAEVEERLAVTGSGWSLFAPTISLDEARRVLPPGTALVEYFAIGDEILAIVVDGNRASAFRELASVADVTEQLARMQFQLRRALRPGAVRGLRGRRMAEDTVRELRGLHRRLFAALQPSLADVARLVVVPHGPLHVLPFHALHDGDAYLVERYEITVVPSASLLSHLADRPDAPAATGPALVVGVADEAAPRIADEARAIAAHLDGTLLAGEAATADTVCEAARNARSVHLACHGRFWHQSPLSSGLLLADRWLTARDLFDLRLPADLVVLSGCDTGLNSVAAGDELIGLLRGFFAAGAKAMMVSLWAANDTATPDIMRHFYDRWHSHDDTPAAALRHAQLEVMHENPHPAIWAPFVLVGQR